MKKGLNTKSGHWLGVWIFTITNLTALEIQDVCLCVCWVKTYYRILLQ